MRKLRLNVDALRVESFEAGSNARDRGTVHGFAPPTDCSKQVTCGMASRGEEAYEIFPRTQYACCV
jgi:hypothetical protein